MISRRGFLTTLAAVAAVATLDPERLLWVPGQKTIFIPNQLDDIYSLTRQYMTPELLDAIFTHDPVLRYLTNGVRPDKGVFIYDKNAGHPGEPLNLRLRVSTPSPDRVHRREYDRSIPNPFVLAGRNLR